VQDLHEDEPESSLPGAQAAAQAPAEITVGASGEQPTAAEASRPAGQPI